MNEQNQLEQILGQKLENFKPAIKPGKLLITGRYSIIESLEIDKHGKELFNSLKIDNQGQAWTYLPYGPFEIYEEYKNWMENVINNHHDTELYAIICAKTKIPTGICGYLRINPEHASIEIGHIHFSKLLNKTTAATESMYLMMREAFEKLGYRRYEWKCNSLNKESMKAAERLGFKFEGIFRQSNVFKNRNRDTAWFSVIDSEWPELKIKFEKWLNPDNFDENGKQIKSL